VAGPGALRRDRRRTMVVSHYLPNRYYSETLIPGRPAARAESYVRSTVTTRIEDRLQSLAQQIMSDAAREDHQEFNLYPKERADGIMEDVVENMRRDIRVDIHPPPAIATPTRSGSVTRRPMGERHAGDERLATLFIDENLRDRGVLAEATSQFLETQLTDARNRLTTQEKKLEDFRKRYSGELPSQMQSNMQACTTRRCRCRRWSNR